MIRTGVILLGGFGLNIQYILLHLDSLFSVIRNDHSNRYKKHQDNEYKEWSTFYQLYYKKISFH